MTGVNSFRLYDKQLIQNFIPFVVHLHSGGGFGWQ